jgi:hypothetical protein
MKIILPLFVLLATASAALSQTSAPATSPTAATQASQPSTDPAAVKILDELEAAGVKYKTIRASKLVYEVLDPALGEKQTRTGYVQFRRDNPADFTRFRIHFDTMQNAVAGPKVIEKKDYAFGPDEDGMQWFSIADYTNKKLTQAQYSKEKVEPLEIGTGPFPLPFGQKTANVLKCCTVTTRPVDPKDPDFARLKDTKYLRLVPRPDFKGKLNFVVLEMWIDPKLSLPIKVVSTEKNKRATTVTFEDVKLNEKMDATDFKLTRPTGWTLEVKRL